jgi:LEA14-like dessication related protein
MRSAFVVMPILIMIMSGCTLTKLMAKRLEKPTFTYTGAELVEASQSRAIVNFFFSAHNPNEAGLKNVYVSYELFVEGKKFLTGNDIPVELKPKSDTEIKVPAVIDYRDLVPVLGSVVQRLLSGRKTIPITIDAVLSGKTAIYSDAGKDKLITFETKLTRTADIPLPSNPLP